MNEKQIGWNIYRKGKYITTVYYDSDMDKEQIKQGLINHDNYPVDIVLRKRR